MTGLRRPLIHLACAWAFAILANGIVAAEEKAATDQPVDPHLSEQVRQAIAGLDDEEFVTRDEAAQRLQQWVENPALGPFMASQFGRVLLSPDTSFEVRARLERLLKQLPPVPLAAIENGIVLEAVTPVYSRVPVLATTICASMPSPRPIAR